MTCREKLAIEHPEYVDNLFKGGCRLCPSSYGYLPDPSDNCNRDDCDCGDCWDREIPEDNEPTFADLLMPKILDSGNRREFETGAVRDIQEGKGRCDLLPLDVVAQFVYGDGSKLDPVLEKIIDFQQTGMKKYLYMAIEEFNRRHWNDRFTACLEVSKHFEEGCKKYGENNWKKGIPVRCYVDSAIRHYLKFLRGDKDEPHDRAFCWNILCAIWTCKHKPELNDYAKSEIKEGTENAV